jgi:hypothetical protein
MSNLKHVIYSTRAQLHKGFIEPNIVIPSYQEKMYTFKLTESGQTLFVFIYFSDRAKSIRYKMYFFKADEILTTNKIKIQDINKEQNTVTYTPDTGGPITIDINKFIELLNETDKTSHELNIKNVDEKIPILISSGGYKKRRTYRKKKRNIKKRKTIKKRKRVKKHFSKKHFSKKCRKTHRKKTIAVEQVQKSGTNLRTRKTPIFKSNK